MILIDKDGGQEGAVGIQCLLLPEYVMEMSHGEEDEEGHPLVCRDPWEPPPPEWDG